MAARFLGIFVSTIQMRPKARIHAYTPHAGLPTVSYCNAGDPNQRCQNGVLRTGRSFILIQFG
jgi:hypothetical protein